MNNEKKWWERPVRMLRMDYAPDFSAIKDEDLEAVARSRKEDWRINCEWIVGTPGFSKATHQTTFKADGYEKYPGLEDFDYLRSYTPIAHEQGIRVLAYLNMHWFSYEFAAEHPDWEQITADGERYGKINPLYGNGTTFCVNSGWREWAFSLMAEAMKTGIDGIFLDGPVIYPGCCYCSACQTEFISAYGRPIPRENWQNPLWKVFLCFRENSLARFLEDAQQAVKQVNPEGVVFLNAGNWEPTAWRVARDIQRVGDFQDFNGAEAFFSYGTAKSFNPYAYMMTGKYLRAGKKPAIVFTHYMNGAWHYLNLPREEINLALAQIAATGANPWLALIHSSLESQPGSHEPVRDIFGFMADREDYFTDYESLAEVGLLFSAHTNRNYLSQHEEIYVTAGSGEEKNLGVESSAKSIKTWSQRKIECEEMLRCSYTGYFQALTRAHIQFDILLDQNLTVENLSTYKTVVLPDAACLDYEAVLALKEFVSKGGNLVCSFEAGQYDAEGDYSQELFELLGIEQIEGAFPVVRGENYEKVISDYVGFKAGDLIERAEYALKVKAVQGAETPMLFMNAIKGFYVPLQGVSSCPALIISSYGQGKVAYFPEALGHFYGVTGMPNAEDRIAGTVKSLISNPMLEIRAPGTISLEAYRQSRQDRIVLHLVNNTVDGRPARHRLPVTDISISVNLDRNPQEVYTLRENKGIEWRMDGSRLEIHIPVIDLYEIVSIEF
ncbi:MAG: beta-galactosidase trimerization domain-containing protein [bacterium]|nr:beta-galactosidase trimerization domain-containing protein [bacterium]